MPLTSTAALKLHLGLTGTGEDAFLDQLLAGVEAGVLLYLGRNIESAAATEYYDGSGREALALRRRPVTAVASVYLDSDGVYGQQSGAFASDTLLTVGDDYGTRNLEENERNPALLVRRGGVWPVGAGNIKVTYTAGYTTVPADIALAVHMTCAVIRESKTNGLPMQSETLGRYSYSLLAGSSQETELTSARSILNRYREVSA